jgi:hypothetical protein
MVKYALSSALLPRYFTEVSTQFTLWRAELRETNKGRVDRVRRDEKLAKQGQKDAVEAVWGTARAVWASLGRMSAVGAERDVI